MTFGSRSLARELLSFNTINPPVDERDCAQFSDHLLEAAGCELGLNEFATRVYLARAQW